MGSSDKELVGLRSKREAAGLTQREFAVRLSALDPEGSWDQSKVSRYEMNEEAIPAGALMRMLRILGESAFVVERPELRGVDLGAPYSDLFSSIADRVTAPKGCSAGWSQPLEEAARTATRKPLVGVLGSYDSGKSTIINSLLGSASMPTSYQPQTFLVTYIHHLDDRPAGSEDEVFLMTDSFNPSAWRSGDTFQDNEVLKSGSLALLARTDEADSRASTAMVFLDAPVLRACSLVDSPGSLERYGHEQDNDITTVKITTLDAAIICSPVNGFMNSDSLAHTLDALHLLSPHAGPMFDRLLIVVTHAHARVSDAVLENEIVKGGARRIADVLNAHAGDTSGAASAEEIRDRIIAFDPEHSARAERFLAEIQRWLGEDGALAHEHRIQTAEAMQREREALSSALDEELGRLKRTAHANPQGPTPLTQQEFNSQVDSSANKLLDKVTQHRLASVTAALATAASYNPVLIERIVKNHFSDKKEAREGAALYVLGLINREIERDLKFRTKEIQAELDDWMGALETKIPKFSTSGGDSTFSFRARIFGAFAGAGVGAAGATAVSAYAATLGNLGAYILVAKSVSALSALGISVGGVAPAVSFIAAIGGPVTIGVAAVSALALAGFTIVGGNWQTTLAKQIHKKLVKEHLFPDSGKATKGPSIPDALSSYWLGIEMNIARAATEAKAAYVDLLADKPDVVDLPGHISELKTTRAWLDGVTFQDLIAQ